MKPFILFKVHITKLIGCQIASALMTKIGNKVIDIFQLPIVLMTYTFSFLFRVITINVSCMILILWHTICKKTLYPHLGKFMEYSSLFLFLLIFTNDWFVNCTTYVHVIPKLLVHFIPPWLLMCSWPAWTCIYSSKKKKRCFDSVYCKQHSIFFATHLQGI